MGQVFHKQTSQATMPQQWRIEPIKNGVVTFDCPTCQEYYRFDSAIFAKNPEVQIEGLTKTDQAVVGGDNFIAQILASAASVIAYYYAGQFTEGILIRLFIGVVVYLVADSIARSLLAAMFTIGKIPIYCYKCNKCQSDIFFAASRKQIALPVLPNKQGGSSGTEEKQKKEIAQLRQEQERSQFQGDSNGSTESSGVAYGITLCPHCEIKVLPKNDGTCPSCQKKIVS